jgi:UDP-2,3-diacylglucosamine hydrolase
MPENPPIIFFSDSHFGTHNAAQEDQKVERFVTLLHHATAQGAEVFFLGDLFDFWFEYKHWIPKTRMPILAAIHAFTSAGGTFHLSVGNHDFWAENYLQNELGVVLHSEDVTVTRHGLRLFISHGDGKAPSETGYRLMKRVLRFRPNILLYRLLPADWAYALAQKFSSHSRRSSQQREPADFSEYDRVAANLLESGCDAVLMGHLHQAWVKKIGSGWWINTGEFYERFTYVTLSDGVFTLNEWNPNSNSS